MPSDPSLWHDGRLAAPAPSGMEWYANIPPVLLDWSQDVHDLNGGRPELHDLRWRMAELFAETGRHDGFEDPRSWEPSKWSLVEELRRAFPGVNLPPVADAGAFAEVMEWSRDGEVRKAIENASDDLPALLSAEILSRAEENWADHSHRTVLGYLSSLDPARGDDVEGLLPGCREVVLRWDRRTIPEVGVSLSPSTLHLEYREYKGGEQAHRSELVPACFRVRRYRDERGSDWYEWRSPGGASTGPAPPDIRCQRRELIDHVRAAFRPSSSMLWALGGWLESLPVMGEVSVRLALTGPQNRSGAWCGFHVPPVFGRQVEGRSDAAGILAGWYRPRPRDVAMARLREFEAMLPTDKHRAILYYVVGAPLVARFAPWRLVPYLENIGESGAGKTETSHYAIAVAWGLGAGPKEFIGGDTIRSAFRRADFLSCTDLPLLVDETSLGRREREEIRSSVNGSLTTRGGTDLLHRGYAPRTPVLFTSNPTPDESDSSDAERHGDERRRIRIFWGHEERSALDAGREGFNAWSRRLVSDPVDPEGGGAVLWLLRDIHSRDPEYSGIRALIDSSRSDVQLVLDLGAHILGAPSITITQETREQSGEAFLEWLRGEAGRYIELRFRTESGRAWSDPLLQRIRVVKSDGSDAPHLDQAESIYVTALALQEYQAHRRRMGGASPYHQLSDLSGIGRLTGQSASDIVGKGSEGRSPRGHVVRIQGASARVARILLAPPAEEDPESVQKRLDSPLSDPSNTTDCAAEEVPEAR